MLPFLIDMDAMLPFAFFLEPFVWNACIFDDERFRFRGGEGRGGRTGDGGPGEGDLNRGWVLWLSIATITSNAKKETRKKWHKPH